MTTRYFDVYAEATVTLQDTTKKYLRDDLVEWVFDGDITSSPFLTLVVSNWNGIYTKTEIFHEGDLIKFRLGGKMNLDESLYEPSTVPVVFSGQIFDIEVEPALLTLKCYSWDLRLIGAQVTGTYYSGDVMASIKDIVQRKIPSIGVDYLIDTYQDLTEEMTFKAEAVRIAILRLATFAGHDFFLRPQDNELMLVPDGYGLNFIDTWTLETEGQPASSWNVKYGTWDVTGYRYRASASGNNVSVAKWNSIEIIDHLGDWIKTKMNLKTGGTNQNAYVVLEYSPTGPTWKFAGLDKTNSLYRIGHFASGVWTTDASAAASLSNDTDYEVEVKVESISTSAFKVHLFVGGSEKTSYQFGSALTGGKLGLGTDSAISHFDEFASYGAGIIAWDADDFEDYRVRRDLMRMGNRAEVVGGYETFSDEFDKDLERWGEHYGTSTITIVSGVCRIQAGGNYEVGLYNVAKFNNFDLKGKVKILSAGTEKTAILRFRDAKESNYYQVEADAIGDTIILKKITSGTPSTLATASVTIGEDTWYQFGVKAVKNNLKVYWGSETVKNVDVIIDQEEGTWDSGYFLIGNRNSQTDWDSIVLVSDKLATGSSGDADLQAKFGTRLIGPISDSSKVTKDSCISHATYLLNLNRYEKTRGSLFLDGTTSPFLGDVINLTIEDEGINAINYRIVRIIQTFKEDTGWDTEIVVAEDIRAFESVIEGLTREAIAAAVSSLVYQILLVSASDTHPGFTDSTNQTTKDFTTGYSWDNAEWDFSTWL